ncbi:MAG: DUF2577 domain-containing protein [Clostridiales bacterium]|nr:DUF2577 domain-containing protein [Clostridiales bacterium]
MRIAEAVKEICKNQTEAGYPADFLTGRVVGVEPYEIRINEKLTLTEKFLIFTETAFGNGYGLDIDDEVALISSNGGQRYLVIDKIAEVE